MRILDRYLIRGFLWPLIYCLALLLILFIIIDGFNNLGEFLKHGASAHIILLYYFYSLPGILVQIVPVSALIAILYVMGNLNRHNEIIAIKASGVSAFQIISPYLFMGIVLSFILFLISETIVPPSQITSTAIMKGVIEKGKKNLNERAIQNVTVRDNESRMIFAREFEILSQTLYDVVILEDDPHQTLKSKMIAKKASFNGKDWVFEDVMRYRLNRRGDIIGEPVMLETLIMDLKQKPEDFVKESSHIEFMSAKQLKEYKENFKGGGKRMSRRLAVDFHYKIAFPFVSFVVMLIGAPLAMRSGRGAAIIGVGASLGVIFLYYAVHSVCLALGKGGILSPFIAAWFSNIFFALVGVYLIKKTA